MLGKEGQKAQCQHRELLLLNAPEGCAYIHFLWRNKRELQQAVLRGSMMAPREAQAVLPAEDSLRRALGWTFFHPVTIPQA